MDALIPFFHYVILKRLTILHGGLPRGGDNHCLGLATQFLHDGGAEMLYNDLDPLRDIGIMQLYKAGDLSLGCVGLTAGIILNFLIDLVEGRVFGVILQYIQNETFLDGLLHGVDMESLPLTFGVQATKELNGGRLRSGGKGEHGHIGLFAVALDLVGDHVLHIAIKLLAGAQRHRNSGHILTGGGGMGLVNDDGKPLIFQPLHAVHDIRKLLDGSGNDFCVTVEGNRQISGITFIVHHPDQPGFMFHAHNGFLELPVHYHTVGNDDDIVEDDLIVGIVERSQAVSQPSDGIGLTGTGTVLDQIILSGTVFPNIGAELTDDIQLVIAREDEVLRTLHFAGFIVHLFLDLYKDELADEVKHGILGQNILPHI